MVKRFYAKSAVSALGLAIVIAGTSTPANAQYLLDRLFGNRTQQQPVRAYPPAPVSQGAVQQQATSKPAPAVKVSAPTFFNYKAETLVDFNLGALKAALVDGDSAENSAFRNAVTGVAELGLQVEKSIGEAIVAYYANKADFIWLDNDQLTPRARLVMDLLNDAETYGLSAADYSMHTPTFPTGSSEEADSRRLRAMLRFELTLSAHALRYARDAHIGRVDPNKLSGFHDFARKPLDERLVLQILASTATPDVYLKALHPQNAIYARLKDELAILRAAAQDEIAVDPHLLLKPGQRHPDFPKILSIIDRDADQGFRDEHGALMVAYSGSDTYLNELVPLIKAAQRKHALNPDGVIGRRTVSVLAGETKAARIEKVVLAMERLRWHPSYLGETRVMLNVPAYTASYIENGKEKLVMRTVVGTATNQTNFFHDEIQYVEFNPYWGVPRSILINEKLPRLRQDPGYLDRTGYEVVDGSGRKVSSASIDWNRYSNNVPFSVRQKPGPSNSLGELKIMFPNRHDIYMHDTPSKSLFSRDTRSFSHGCVRLEDPRAMAAAVLGTTKDDVGKMIAGGRNGRKNVPVRIPVYVSYFTAWADEAGNVSYYEDIYGRDAHLAKAIAQTDEARLAGS